MGFETDVKDENGETALHQIFKPQRLLQHMADSIIAECCRSNSWNSVLDQLVVSVGKDLKLSGFRGFDSCFLLRLARDFKSCKSHERFDSREKAILSNLNHIIERKFGNYTAVNCRGDSSCEDCEIASRVMKSQSKNLIGAYLTEKTAYLVEK